MTAPTPAQAAARAFVTGCVARGLTASAAAVPPEGQLEAVRELWADVARASVAAYINENGRDPVDARSIILEAVELPVVTAGRLGTAMKGKRILVTGIQSASGEGMWLAVPARPHDLAVQLLTAIDPRLTGDAPEPASAVPCSVCEDEAATSPHGVPGLGSPQLREAVLAQVREAASCASADGDECEKCGGHADVILAAVLAAADGSAR